MRSAGWMGLFVLSAGLAAHPVAAPAQDDAFQPLAVSPEGGDTDLSVTDITPAFQAMYDGMFHAQEERYAEAIPLLKTAIELDPTLIGAWETLGWSYWHLGRADEAESLWNRLRLLNPDLWQVHVWLAQIASARRNLPEASRLFDEALKRNPGDYDLRSQRAQVLMWRGRLGEAVVLLRELLNEDPDRFDVALELARTLQYIWRYEEALPLWETLLAIAPDVPEYRLGVALSFLHTGRRAEATEIAQAVLDDDPENITALSILADDAEYGEHPHRATPYLRRALAACDDAEQRHALHRRLTTLLTRLHQSDPILHSIDAAISAAQRHVDDEPANIEALLTLAELLLMDQRLEDSETRYYEVLRGFNAHNVRARRGLFEIALVRFKFDEAREHLDRLRAFNPNDPYLLASEARFHARRGDFHQAHKALDELERRGSHGAAAVLRYSVVTPSDIGPAMPLKRMREQWLALRAAGYRFLTPEELPDFFAMSGDFPRRAVGIAPVRAVLITFDGALEPAMTLAGKLAAEMGIVLHQFVPVGAVEKDDALVAGWDDLRDHDRTGRWHFGSLLYDAHHPVQTFSAGAPQSALANRLRSAHNGSMENAEAFSDRIDREYAVSREVLRERLGRLVTSCAYPDDDIGQHGMSNEPLAASINLAQAERYYDTAFISHMHGHAVHGDNPFLYGRTSPLPWSSGDDLTRQLLSSHPVLLAQRMRLEFAAFEGRRGLARNTLDQMKRSGYPDDGIREMEKFLHERLARKFDVPTVIEDARKAPWRPVLEKPFLAVSGHWFEDRLDNRVRRVDANGGLHLTPNVIVSARVGAARHDQPGLYTEAQRMDEAEMPRDLLVKERAHGVSAAVVLPRRMVVSGDLGVRDFSHDAEYRMWRYDLALNARPIEAVDLKLEYEHDAVDGARALRRELTHRRMSAHGVWSPNDVWDIWGSMQHFDFSDDNRRQHWHVLPTVLLWRRAGLIAGLRYAEDHSPNEDRDYWTPYRQQGLHLEVGFRGSWLRHYYSLIGSVGKARERTRPEAQQAYDDLLRLYEDLLTRARRGRWGGGAIRDLEREIAGLRAEAPDAKWETMLGVQASVVLRWRKNWEFEGLASYEESPRYDATHLGLGVRYRF